jgi:mRNA-degrading endonuclease toxin of MazEF toxin-antitoxin module
MAASYANVLFNGDAAFVVAKEFVMAVPWLVVGNLVLGNLDKIMAVVRPAFTRRNAAAGAQAELLDQQITELQSASAANAEQIRALASQFKDVVAALEQAGLDAAAERTVTRRIALAALVLAVAGCALGVSALLT